MNELIEQMEKELEEYGPLHSRSCGVMSEDDCNCDMNGMKPFVVEQMQKVNEWWCRMAEAHRPHCKPEGNKMLTNMMGKHNRNRSNPL